MVYSKHLEIFSHNLRFDAKNGYILEGKIMYGKITYNLGYSGSLHFHSDTDGDGFIENCNGARPCVSVLMQ